MKLALIVIFSFMSAISSEQNFTTFDDDIVYSYNEKDAITYTYASSLAYCDIKTIKPLSCGVVCDYLKNFEVLSVWMSHAGPNSITYVILYNVGSKTLVISFRGTNEMRQLISELGGVNGVPYTLHSIGEAKVYDYFYSHYKNDLRSQFLTDFNNIWKQYSSKVKKIAFTGHSLGGAITTHAVADLLHSNTIDSNSYQVQLYTFGCPRVGDYKWISALQQKLKSSYRVVHNEDAVAHLPTCNPLKGTNSNGCNKSGGSSKILWYAYHLPQEIWYKNKDFSSYKICDSNEGEDQTCSNSLIKYSVPDHLVYFGVHLGWCRLE